MASLSRLSVSRRDLGVRKWVNWLQGGFEFSAVYAWLQACFCSSFSILGG